MGFLASDILGNYLGTLLRVFPNPNHHSFAYLPAKDGKKQLNHVAFMVESIDDIGKLFNRIEAHGVKRAFGIGRHPTSGSIHLYIFDPDSMVWEYTLGMEQFPETRCAGGALHVARAGRLRPLGRRAEARLRRLR